MTLPKPFNFVKCLSVSLLNKYLESRRAKGNSVSQHVRKQQANVTPETSLIILNSITEARRWISGSSRVVACCLWLNLCPAVEFCTGHTSYCVACHCHLHQNRCQWCEDRKHLTEFKKPETRKLTSSKWRRRNTRLQSMRVWSENWTWIFCPKSKPFLHFPATSALCSLSPMEFTITIGTLDVLPRILTNKYHLFLKKKNIEQRPYPMSELYC